MHATTERKFSAVKLVAEFRRSDAIEYFACEKFRSRDLNIGGSRIDEHDVSYRPTRTGNILASAVRVIAGAEKSTQTTEHTERSRSRISPPKRAHRI